MNFRAIALITGTFVFIGCSQSMRLYPIRGPITTESPIPTIKVTIQPFILAGRISLVLPTGETCHGTWNNNVANMPGSNAQVGTVPSEMNLSGTWDEVYGAGYFVAHVVGDRDHGQALLTGTNGTTIRMDFLHPFTQDQIIQLVGVAVDNKGNIFKITS